MPVVKTTALLENRVNAVANYHKKNDVKRAQLDVSGGLDSAVMLGILCHAVGRENITAVYSNINSSNWSYERANEVAESFGVKLIAIDLSDMFWDLMGKMYDNMENAGYDRSKIVDRVKADPTVQGSIRSCLRAPIGRGFNRLAGDGIRHGTGNECEDRWLRFYQKGGDGEVDTNPIAMLSKGETFQLGGYLSVPPSILKATPSHDLHDGAKTSEDENEIRHWSGVDWNYSRVDHVTGQYTKVGSIERMSRFLDSEGVNLDSMEEILFTGRMRYYNVGFFIDRAKPFFTSNLNDGQILSFIESAINIERVTRHKMNPNCPTLGTRDELIKAGILTNTLPEV